MNQSTIKVACIGDSITKGYGLANPEEESYPAQLQKLLGDEYEVRNFGANGRTLLRYTLAPYSATDECWDALDYCADIAIIGLGTNDMLPGNIDEHESEFVEDYMALINALLCGNPDMKLYLLLPYCSKIKGIEQEYMDRWFNHIKELFYQVATECGPAVVDVIKQFYEDQANNPALIPDGVHPGKYGSIVIASITLKKSNNQPFRNDKTLGYRY